jgi:hypothetical protein
MKREDDERLKENIFVTNPNNPNTVDVISETKEGLGLIVEEKLGGLTVIDENVDKSIEVNEKQVDNEIPTKIKTENHVVTARQPNSEDFQIVSADYSFGNSSNVNLPSLKNNLDPELTKNQEKDAVFNTLGQEKENINQNIIENIQAKKYVINKNQEIEDSNIVDRKHDDSDDSGLPNKNKESIDSQNNAGNDTVIKDADNNKIQDNDSTIPESGRDEFNFDDLSSLTIKPKVSIKPIINIQDANLNNSDEKTANPKDENSTIEPVDEIISNEDNIEKTEYEIPTTRLKEEKLFYMEEMPSELMNKIERRAEEIIGEIKEKKDKKVDDYSKDKDIF